MSWLIVAGWFVCGLAALHIIDAMSVADEGVREDPDFCWVSLLGPLLLVIVLIFLVQEAVTKKEIN